jgi:NAD(P)-dependent dehydrogenase (short-subunit alcohol dehydrogenase family)
MDRHESRIAWLLGASSGIGRQLALRLATAGWRIAASARHRERLEALAAEIMQGVIVPHPCDVRDETGLRRVIASIEADMGPIHTAVLNAGDYEPMPLEEFDTELFQRPADVNFLGIVRALGAVLPPMLERRRGQVLISASVAGYRGLPLGAPYGATKAALINMAEALQPELAACGIRLRIINPGFVKTPMTDKNAFRMPAIVSPETAAECIAREIDGKHFEITFPKRFTYPMKILRCLPYRLYFAVVRRMTGR